MLDCAGKSNGICKVLEVGPALRLTARPFHMHKSRGLCPRCLAGTLRHKVTRHLWTPIRMQAVISGILARSRMLSSVRPR